MSLKRCIFCGKHFQLLNKNRRCKQCEDEYTFISKKIHNGKSVGV